MKRARNENAVLHEIERMFASSQGDAMSVGLGDDAALWRARRGHEVILTCDWSLEGSHFLRNKHSAHAVGWKSLARAVSDIAAMGGAPRCFLLSLALPGSYTGKWLTFFLRGVRDASRAFGCNLAGGDTTRRNEILVSITVIGEIRKGQAILRSGARPGDLLYVSGTLGEADLGLRQILRERGPVRPRNTAQRKHLYPEPRLALGNWLAANHLTAAMMDLSDGLSTDLPRLCAASGVGARVDAASLPVSVLTKRKDALALALHGGDDYELLFAVNPRKAKRLPQEFQGLPLTQIGEFTREKKIVVLEEGKAYPLRSGGWDPFRG
jgi:thiamine-monophosphate kinase